MAAYDELDAAFDKVAALNCDALNHEELLVLMNRMERNVRRAPVVAHHMINRLVAEANPKALGAPR